MRRFLPLLFCWACGAQSPSEPNPPEQCGLASAPCSDTADPTDTGTDTGTGPSTWIPTSTPPGFSAPVHITASPHNSLSFRLAWETEEPAAAVVEYGQDGLFTWRITLDDPAPAHEAILWGLRAERDVVVRVLATFEDGNIAESETLTVRTGALPESVPVAEVGALDRAQMAPGWTLLNVSNRHRGWPSTAVLYDEEGQPVWYAINGTAADTRGDTDPTLTPWGTILMGGSGTDIAPVEVAFDGEVLWHGPPQDPPFQHHHLEALSDGTYVMLRHIRDPEWPGLTLDQVVQIDAAHDVVWRWNPFDHLSLPEGASGDFLHLNSLTMDVDAVYVNARNISTLFKLDRATGEVIWRLGANRDFTLADGTWFRHQHDPELQADGTWLIYDNQGLGQRTRVVQMALDEATMTAEIVWEFPGDAPVDAWYREVWHSAIWGDADRLSNGNVLVAAGARHKQSRVFEVTPDREVVWELILPTWDGEDVTATYRADRIVPPGLERIDPPLAGR